MACDRDEFDRVIDRIETAFADVSHPGDDALLHPDCMDDGDVAAYYGSIAWRDIPARTIARESASLGFLSATGFQFLLPAYMIWTLRNFDSGWASVEGTIWALDPGRFGGPFREHNASQYALLTEAQREAIVAFLKALTKDKELEKDACSVLRSYWTRDGEDR